MAARGAAAPVRRGQRVALPPATPPADKAVGQIYVVGVRPLTYRGLELPSGVEVPGAASWLRIEAWVNARRVRPLGEGEEYKPYAEFLTENDLVDPEEAARAAQLLEAEPTQESTPTEE